MTTKIPQPVIYLRNKFSIRPGLTGRFFDGQKDLLSHTRPGRQPVRNSQHGLGLVAAGGTSPLVLGAPVPQPLPKCMHLWRLPEWSTLYQLMYTFTESDWYTSEVSSLQIEHQDLLIGIGSGIQLAQRPLQWQKPGVAGYVYVYDEVRLNVATTKFEYLRQLNWFAAQVGPQVGKRGGWELIWIAAEVTGTPSQVCALWKVPGDASAVDETMAFMAYDPSVAKRSAAMAAGMQTFSRQVLYPESTEELDNEMNPRTVDDNPRVGSVRPRPLTPATSSRKSEPQST